MGTGEFYSHLESFSDFNDITHDPHFESVPGDWYVIIADIRGSTQAIESGRYRDVNTIGAAAISVVQNELNQEFPYVFGGDGATLLLPPRLKERAIDALNRLVRLAKQKFQFELRVGAIAVEEVVDETCRIEVAKFELAAGKCVAIFRGGGLTVAEKKIKAEEASHSNEPQAASEGIELVGLSCRWQNIPSKHGRILSLLVASQQADASAVYEKILNFLNEQFGDDFKEANPINTELMEYKSIQQCLRDEGRYHSSKWTWGYAVRVLEIIFSNLIFKYKMPALIFNAEDYRNSMAVHSDYRKFDDMLRMIIDCTPEQARQIRDHLHMLHAEGAIFFGLHESETALMTCYVQEVSDGEHIHFIDGGDGGYAMAAKEMKEQMRAVNA